jgi:hypothetical protein
MRPQQRYEDISLTAHRHIGTSLSSFGEWLATFLTTFAGPIGISNIGWRLYIWILVGDLCFVAFVYLGTPPSLGGYAG